MVQRPVFLVSVGHCHQHSGESPPQTFLLLEQKSERRGLRTAGEHIAVTRGWRVPCPQFAGCIHQYVAMRKTDLQTESASFYPATIQCLVPFPLPHARLCSSSGIIRTIKCYPFSYQRFEKYLSPCVRYREFFSGPTFKSSVPMELPLISDVRWRRFTIDASAALMRVQGHPKAQL